MSSVWRTPDPKGEATARPVAWTQTRERSNRWCLQTMAWIAVTFGRRVARWALYPISAYFVLFAAGPRRASIRYLTRALGREARWTDGFRHVHAFAATVLDRVYFVRGCIDQFDVKLRGGEVVDAVLAEGRGAVLIGAHFGSFEALHALSDDRPELEVAMVMYPQNARMIHATLQALAPDFKLGIIELGRSGATLEIRDWVDRGGVVGLLADRSLPTESARVGALELPFLGATARFTDGPMRLAQLLRRKVIFMVGLYEGGNRYDVRFETLADFTQPCSSAEERERHVREAVQAYARKLEALCLESPYNWFNFYDFWAEDSHR